VLLVEVQDAVAQAQVEHDVRVGAQELGRDRGHVQPAERQGRRHGQLAARRPVFAGGGALGLLDLLEDAPARRGVGLARVRERDPARRAVQQPRVQVRLQLRDAPAHRGQRRPELPGGGGKAAGPDDREQGRHRLEAVHAAFRFLEGC
jgi:hypothetical protein